MTGEFRMRSKNTYDRMTINEQLAQEIITEPVKIKEFGGKFLYCPTVNIPVNTPVNIPLPKKQNSYGPPKDILKKIEYEEELIVYDSLENKWKLIKKTEECNYI